MSPYDAIIAWTLIGTGSLGFLVCMAYVALELVGRWWQRRSAGYARPTANACDYCANNDPHGLELVMLKATRRLRLVCRPCALEGAALGAHTVLERGRKGK